MLDLLVLGSGGPFVNGTRASSGFLLSAGDARLLVDAGGGVFTRLGEAGGGARAIDPVLLTHLHIDHSGGLAPLVFSAFMEGRTEPITVLGPARRDDQPGVVEFCERLFGEDGAWSYLTSFTGFGVDPLSVPSTLEDPAPADALRRGGLVIRSVAVPHGMMPAVAYRVECDGKSIVFSGDVEAEHRPLIALAHGCDVLVHDFALPEREVEHGHLHAKPSEVGRVAAAVDCPHLILTHVMPELEDEIEPALAQVRASYGGEITIAHDGLQVRI